MQTTPKSLRLQIGIFGRTNVGKSSFLNMVAGQAVAITSPVPGTTTDVVEKSMELLPIGPVVFLDTAGVDDASCLKEARLEKTRKIFDRADSILLIVEPTTWTDYESDIVAQARQRNIPIGIIINKVDITLPDECVLKKIADITTASMSCSSITRDAVEREQAVRQVKDLIIEIAPESALATPPLIGDLLPPGGMAALIVPIDLEAPKGRLILPQVQTIRDALDNDASAVVVKEREFAALLNRFAVAPDIVICDSQVVLKMVADTPVNILCTTFSILFSRLKGDLVAMAEGAAILETLRPGDKVLIAESCSHHPIADDIGRVKIPRWIRQYVGGDLAIDICAGRDYPDNVQEYKLIMHCGSCMLTRKETMVRIQRACSAGVAITNYGMGIALVQGVLDRVLEPFPLALKAFKNKKKTLV